MKWILLKIILFFGGFIVLIGTILPMAISNNFLPLWCNILLSSIVFMGYMMVTENLIKKAIKIKRKTNVITKR